VSIRSVAVPRGARGVFGAVQFTSVALAARLAERWFFTPPRRGVTAAGADVFRSAGRFELMVDGRVVVGWTWGRGPAVYLVHGWGSRALRMAAYAEPLIALGHRVVAFDAPGHGESARGLSSLPEFARTLRAVIDEHGPARAVIAHSLGASASALAAAWGVEAGRFVLLAPTADPAAYAEAFAAALRARPDVMARARANSARRLGFRWSELDVRAMAGRMRAPALVVHDEEDDVVPFGDGASIAAMWPGARLLATRGLGHRAVVNDADVVTEVVRFVTDAPATHVPTTDAARLEYELFYRESRW
jgi:pimeloyl-ACP methyl ester carboxylesterase